MEPGNEVIVSGHLILSHKTLHGLYQGFSLSLSVLPVFCSLVCIQYNTQKWKSGKKWGRPGLMSRSAVDVGGRGQSSIMYKLSSKACYLSRRAVSTILTSELHNCGRALKQMIQCIVLWLGPSSPCIYLVSM